MIKAQKALDDVTTGIRKPAMDRPTCKGLYILTANGDGLFVLK